MAERPFYDNRLIKRTEDLITVQQLKDRYLRNINLVDFQGNPIEDQILNDYISMAVSEVEVFLDIYIIPTQHEPEEKDYWSNDYWNWGYFLLNNVPVIEITNIIAVYPNSEVLEYPVVWLKLQPHDGTVRIIPTAGTLAQFQVDAGGQYFPEIFRYNGNVPLVWQITYSSGFAPGKIPTAINHCVGLTAAIFLLNNLGSGILNPGIVSTNVSLDGISQSVNTAMSGTTHAYSGLVEEYTKVLFGEPGKNPANRGLLSHVKDNFHGNWIQIV